MEATAQKEKTIVAEKLLKGRWKLTYSLVNDKGIAGFSGRQIGPYQDPITSKTRVLKNHDGLEMSGYFMDTTQKDLEPDINPWHITLLDWLIAHPLIGIENNQVHLSKEYMSKKDDNPRFKLINLDHQDTVELENEDYIDKLIGTISLDAGVNAISLEKLRFILSALSVSYREERYINNKVVEKQKLRQRLKKYVRASYKNAQDVNAILENLDNAKIEYEIKEMVRLGILNISNAMYKYDSNPIGITTDSVKQYFNNNPDFYSELVGKLYEELKRE